ncbi:hypothetical protein [Rahnella contaminans]|uniref:hypothetical protein n=1 Tax=Rahnella contaminans TaxID=2703882 RepID=UPI003C2BE31E
MTTTTGAAALPQFSEGVVFDGSAILRDGIMMTVGEILEALTSGAAAEARVNKLERENEHARKLHSEYWHNMRQAQIEREELKGKQIPVAWLHDRGLLGMKVVTLSEVVANSWREKGWEVTALAEVASMPAKDGDKSEGASK